MKRIAIWEAPEAARIAASADAFLAGLSGPTLVRVPGRDRTRTRAVVTLLHGNEPSGFRAVHAWLRSGVRPAVDLVCWLAAVEAARAGSGFAHRMLPGGRDLNRCFRPPFDGPEGALAEEALGLLRDARPEALIDLHNNTGHNPPYGVGARLDPLRLGLTALFARRFVHTTIRLGALTEVGVDDLNAVAIECGRAGDASADATACVGLTEFLQCEVLPLAEPSDLVVLGEPIRVTVRPGVRIAFGERPGAGVDLTLRGDIDRHNFEPLLPGVPVGWLAAGADWPVLAVGEDGEDVSRDYFVLEGHLLVTRRAMVPIMMTTDPVAARGDCLFYMTHQR